jgi:hypothetical protein
MCGEVLGKQFKILKGYAAYQQILGLMLLI